MRWRRTGTAQTEGTPAWRTARMPGGRYGRHCYRGRDSLCGLASLPPDHQNSTESVERNGVKPCEYCRAIERIGWRAASGPKRMRVEAESRRQKKRFGLTVQEMLYNRLTADAGPVTVSEMAELAAGTFGVDGETAVAMMIREGMAAVRGDVLVPEAAPAGWRPAA